MDPAEHYTDLVRTVVEGRPVILSGLLAGVTRFVNRHRSLGAGPFLVIATGLGTGEFPDPADTEHVLVDIEATDPVDDIRRTERLLADPPAEVTAALEAFDPARSALVFLAPHATTRAIGNRPVYGARRPEWVALEDKTVCDALFDECAVARPPAEVVAAQPDDLVAAARRLDTGAGTVWAGDAREGFNGGGVFVRRLGPGLEPAEDRDEAVSFFAAHCDRVRVAPFVDGIPSSIHGFVCDDGVAAFRPVELVNLRRPGASRFAYAGAATFWDPPDDQREAMRAAVRRVGARLGEQWGYRGGFTIDGILGAKGWVATELNSRPGAGLGYASRALPEFPFDLLHCVAAEGDGAEIRAAELEAIVVEAGDRARSGNGWMALPKRQDATEVTPVVFEDGGCRRARAGDGDHGGSVEGEPSHATISIGPGSEGGFMLVSLDPQRTPVGPSVAPRMVAAFAFADRELGTAIGPVEPAPDLTAAT